MNSRRENDSVTFTATPPRFDVVVMALNVAREATEVLPIVKLTLSAAARIERLAKMIDKDRKALHALADGSLRLAQQIQVDMGGKTLDPMMMTCLVRVCRVFDRIELFMREYTAHARLRRAINHVFTVPKQVNNLSRELADCEEDLALVSRFAQNRADMGVRSHAARDDWRRDPFWPPERTESLIERIVSQDRIIDELTAVLMSHENAARVTTRQVALHDTATSFLFPFVFQGQAVQIRAPTMNAFAYGASGRVVRAVIEASHTNQGVVLKVPHYAPTEEEKELLRREVKIWGKMDHARILPFYGICDVGGGHSALVSQYMENGNLSKYLAANLDADRLVLVQQVAEGLEYLHKIEKIVHGDLKCENILITNQGSAVLCDFGLSTLIEAGSNITITNIRIRNTIRFAAPELLFDEATSEGRQRSKTTSSDVYAFGMLVYQAYTGTPPWPNDSDMALYLKIMHGELPPRPDDATLLHDALWELCRQCWSFDQRERPRIELIRESL